MRIKLDLDKDTTQKLVERSASDRRPVAWEAEVLLRQALGLPFPFGHEEKQQPLASPDTTLGAS